MTYDIIKVYLGGTMNDKKMMEALAKAILHLKRARAQLYHLAGDSDSEQLLPTLANEEIRNLDCMIIHLEEFKRLHEGGV